MKTIYAAKKHLSFLTPLLLTMLYTASLVTVQAAENQPDVTVLENSDIIQQPSGKLDEPTTQLLNRVEDNLASLRRYEDASAKASDEDLQVLNLQIYKTRVKIMDDIHLLADELINLEKKGIRPKLREQVKKTFTHITPLLWNHIEHLRQKIDAIRASRMEASPEERATIEYSLADLNGRLDVFFQISQAHISKMEQLGIKTQEATNTFTGLLEARSDELVGRIDLALVRIQELNKQSKGTPDNAVIAAHLRAVKKSLDTNVASLKIVASLMEASDLDTEELRSFLVTATRDIGSGIVNTDVAIRLLDRSRKNMTAWLSEKVPGYLIKIIILIGILLVFRFATRLMRVGLEKALSSSNVNLSELARRMIISSASKLVMVFGILVILSQLGISLGPLLAGLGVAGFIIGFALQDSLSNFAAGVMILLYRPYDVGDFVDVGGVVGTVDKMSLVSTSLLTIDNQLYIVPNSKIWGDVIKNVTAQKIRRVDMVFGISYSDDIENAEAVLADILKSHEKVLDDPESVIRLHTLGDSSVDFIVRPWVNVEDYWEVYWDITRAVKMRFDEERISIPFPQRDVHIYQENSPVSE